MTSYAPWRRVAETEWGLHTHRLLLGQLLHVIVYKDDKGYWRWLLEWQGGPQTCPDCCSTLWHCGHQQFAAPMCLDIMGYKTLRAAKCEAVERMTKVVEQWDAALGAAAWRDYQRMMRRPPKRA
jgi:hypothetical protein